MLWRWGLLEDLSDFAAAAAPAGFAAPLGDPIVALFTTGDGATASTTDVPGPSSTVSPCPTAAMAVILCLGSVLVEPME